MKLNLKSVLLAAVALLALPLARAQLTLHNFSAFESANTVFVGDWELTGDTIGTGSPRSGFAQGAGFYTFAGGSNSDTASAFYFFDAPLNMTGLSLLQVSARLLAGNTAPTFTISLFDSLGESAFAVFSTAAFAGPGFTTLSAALTFSPGFDRADLSSFQISGNVLGGSATLGISLDHLAVAAPRALTAVPEPAAYGWVSVAILGGAIVFSRKKRRRAE